MNEPAAIVIDCTGITTCEIFWQRYLEAVRPTDAADFGCNLDALWDAVQWGGPGDPGADAVLVIRNTQALEPIRTLGGKPFLDGLRRLAADTTRLRIDLS